LRAFKTAVAMPSYFEAERTVRFRGISRAVVGDDDRNKYITFAWGIRHTRPPSLKARAKPHC